MPLADFLPSQRVIKGLFLFFLTTVIAAGVPLTFPDLFSAFFFLIGVKNSALPLIRLSFFEAMRILFSYDRSCKEVSRTLLM